MADLIDQGVVNNIINSDAFLKALESLPIDTKAALELALTEAFEQGLGIAEIVAKVVDVIGSSVDRVDRIIRTESHRLSSAGHQQEFLDAKEQGVNSQMLLLAVLDDRVRPQSASMDGKKSDTGLFKYPNGTVAVPGNTGNPAYDINDRERAVQIIDDISPALRRTKDDGIIPFQTYEEWAASKGLEKNAFGVKLFP
jgi:hypothetical protein